MKNGEYGFPPAVDETFEGLYRSHRLEVYRTLLRATGNKEEAEDLAQKTFLNAYTALRRGNRPQEPRAWLHAIARNTRRRRYRTQGDTEVELDPETATSREEEIVPLGDLRAALRELTPNQRASFLLFEVGGLTYHEIADRLELTPAAVESLLVRARRTLRATLGRAKRILLGAPLLNGPGWVSRLFDTGQGSDLALRAAGALGAAAVGTGLVAGAVVLPGSGNAHRSAVAPAAVASSGAVTHAIRVPVAHQEVRKAVHARPAAAPALHRAARIVREPRTGVRVAAPRATPVPPAPVAHVPKPASTRPTTPVPAVPITREPVAAESRDAAPAAPVRRPQTPSDQPSSPVGAAKHLHPVETAKAAVASDVAIVVPTVTVPVALPVDLPVTTPELPEPPTVVTDTNVANVAVTPQAATVQLPATPPISVQLP